MLPWMRDATVPWLVMRSRTSRSRGSYVKPPECLRCTATADECEGEALWYRVATVVGLQFKPVRSALGWGGISNTSAPIPTYSDERQVSKWS